MGAQKTLIASIASRPVTRILAAQALAVVGLVVLVWATRNVFAWKQSISENLWQIILLHALLAFVSTAVLGLRRVWLVLGFLMPVVAWLGFAFAVAPWVYLLAVAILLLVFSNVFHERVPLYLSNRATWAALAKILDDEMLAQRTGRPQFADLGCGMGGVIAVLARRHPDWDFVGVETAPLPYALAKLRVFRLANAQVQFQSLWGLDLGRFNVVYAFLSPAPMARLLAKVEAEMSSGSLFVSNSFWHEDTPFDAQSVLDDSRQTHLIFKRL